MHPVLIDFFGYFQLHTYGLMIATAFLVGMQLAVRDGRRLDFSEKKVFDQFILDLCFWILLAAMAGARIMFIIVNWGDYSADPLKMFRVWEGGFVFYGGLIGAVLFSVAYCRRKGYRFFLVADTLIPMVALGQFFGRLGCLAAGCCWGQPTSEHVFTAVQFPAGSLIYSSMHRAGQIAVDATHTMHVHPVQMYESFGTLMIFFILQGTRKFKRIHGQILVSYMFMYAVLRSTLETVRFDAERGIYEIAFGLSLSTSQIISTGIGIIALTITAFLVRSAMTERPPATA